MQIEIHIPSGRLLAVTASLISGHIGRLGNGEGIIVQQAKCIPHSTMCGPFSRDQRIAQQAVILSNATATRGSADYWATQYTKRFGVLKP